MPLKLLVIEGDKSASALMTQSFTSQGAEVYAVGDFDAASAMLHEAKFDGIFLDLSLPARGGIELMRRVRDSSRNSKTPVVLLGKSTDSRAAAEAFRAGGTFFLCKPLQRKALRQAFNSARPVMLNERRRYWRIPLSTPLQCLVGGRELSGCLTRNISLSGILVQDNEILQPHNKVLLSFRLAEAGPLIIVRGVVVRRDERGQVGVRFTSINPADHERILNRIAREVDNL